MLILGSTGSIGRQALQVAAESGDLEVVGLACGRSAGLLAEQAAELEVRDVAVDDVEAAGRVAAGRPELRVRAGHGAAAQLVRDVEADVVLNAVVGFAGLEATLATLDKGVDLALANKESLVSAGNLVTARAEATGARLLPVDSEHSALFQLLQGHASQEVRSLIITASGGPFRGWPADKLEAVTPEQALAHPTWHMGPKITIDSATLMNKGLEVIEAHHLFGVEYERIEVAVHPQSVVHSLVRLVDGALLAHLGVPDMRVPIAYALHYPHRLPAGASDLQLPYVGSLSFEEPDERLFPSIALAREAGRRGDGVTCAMNAANEVAVHAFLRGTISFPDITAVAAGAILDWEPEEPRSFEAAEAVDAEARGRAAALCARAAATFSEGSAC
ncbi:MAG: 1-deoxy-D-xylulose-5-phosphate reductoisomerase [Gaiellales bacterium]|nr:1-deoxy-D-xylulose-5-phosphate reductoisomerase [Gaiellales bacterium]